MPREFEHDATEYQLAGQMLGVNPMQLPDEVVDLIAESLSRLRSIRAYRSLHVDLIAVLVAVATAQAKTAQAKPAKTFYLPVASKPGDFRIKVPRK